MGTMADGFDYEGWDDSGVPVPPCHCGGCNIPMGGWFYPALLVWTLFVGFALSHC